MKSRIAYAILLSASAFALLVLAQQLRTSQKLAATYTIKYVENAANLRTGKTLETIGWEARRADGSTANGLTVRGPDGSLKVTRNLFMESPLRTIQVLDTMRFKTTFNNLRVGRPGHYQTDNAPLNCDGQDLVFLGDDEFLGVRVQKYATNNPVRHLETWMAPELDCKALWHRLEIKAPDGSLTEYSERKVFSVDLSEPRAELFMVPADYEELSPANALQRVATYTGKACKECTSHPAFAALQKKYEDQDHEK